MAHYAFLDASNIVTEVIPGNDETDTRHDWEQYYGAVRGQTCKRTSYNGNYRKNFAGAGYEFRPDLNLPDGAFIAPQPFPSWSLDPTSCQWVPPVPQTDRDTGWDEATLSWVPL
jgi:hypothetical protein